MMGDGRLQNHIGGFDLENIFHSMSELVSIHDRDFRIIRVNKSLSRYLGKDEAELIGKHCYKVFHNRIAPYDNCPHARSMDTLKPVTEEILDEELGTTFVVSCSPIFDDNDELIGSVHIAREAAEPLDDQIAREQLSEEMENSLMALKALSGILTICSSCKSIRDDEGEWVRIEKFITRLSKAVFSHGICPDCTQKLYPDINSW